MIRALASKSSQRLLRDIATAMDAMPVKALVRGLWKDPRTNAPCTVGCLLIHRGMPTNNFDFDDCLKALKVSKPALSAITEENDLCASETPEARWFRMRAWVAENILPEQP